LEALTAAATDTTGGQIVPHTPFMVPAFAVGPNGIPVGPNGQPSPVVIAELAGAKRKRDPNKPRKPRAPPQADDSGRTCTTCGTSVTPKWRCGMTLCNACGLRTSKKAQQVANRQAIANGVDANGIPTVPATAIASVMPGMQMGSMPTMSVPDATAVAEVAEQPAALEAPAQLALLPPAPYAPQA